MKILLLLLFAANCHAQIGLRSPAFVGGLRPSSYRYDGGTRTTMSATPGADSFKGMSIGGYITTVLAMAGDIGEIIVRDDSATTDEAEIFAYLNSRWAVY